MPPYCRLKVLSWMKLWMMKVCQNLSQSPAPFSAFSCPVPDMNVCWNSLVVLPNFFVNETMESIRKEKNRNHPSIWSFSGRLLLRKHAITYNLVKLFLADPTEFTPKNSHFESKGGFCFKIIQNQSFPLVELSFAFIPKIRVAWPSNSFQRGLGHHGEVASTAKVIGTSRSGDMGISSTKVEQMGEVSVLQKKSKHQTKEHK